MLQPVGTHDLGKRPFLWLPSPVWSADFQNQLTLAEVLAGNALKGVHHVFETFAGSRAPSVHVGSRYVTPSSYLSADPAVMLMWYVCSLFCRSVGS